MRFTNEYTDAPTSKNRDFFKNQDFPKFWVHILSVYKLESGIDVNYLWQYDSSNILIWVLISVLCNKLYMTHITSLSDICHESGLFKGLYTFLCKVCEIIGASKYSFSIMKMRHFYCSCDTDQEKQGCFDGFDQ